VGGFLGALGGKLAERWLTLLVLPGALFLAAATSAHTLGQSHSLDYQRLTAQITQWAKTPAATTLGGQVVLVAAVLAGSAAVGLVAQALGTLVQRITLAADWRAWPRPSRWLARWRVTRRHARWSTAARRYEQHRHAAALALAHGNPVDSAPRHTARRAMTRIGLEAPDRPTWSGDRIHATAVRLDRDHHLDLPSLWPHLWLTLPDPVRTEITTAGQALTRATTLGGWALLYASLTGWWWPAAPLAIVLALTAWQRTRTATDTYAQLLEAATRLHTRDLADQLGIPRTGPLDPAIGDALTHLLNTRLPPPPIGTSPPS
jgi:hypothetical protein